MTLPAKLAAWWNQWRGPKPLGSRGEQATKKYLKRKGDKIVARVLRRRGEDLDLGAVNGRTAVFVEVKTRRGPRFGHPTQAVDERKQRRITRGALVYLKRHGLLKYKSRFDIVAVTWPDPAKKPTIEHFPNAFEAVGSDGMFS